MKKLIAVLLALSCMLIGAAAVAETLNIAYMPNYGSLWSVETAINKGYFEEEGLTINLVEFADGPTIIAAMESGSIDMGYIGQGAHKLCINGRASIFALSHISNGDALIGGKGIATVEDLKGKVVAYSSGTSSEDILKNSLDKAGMTMDDIKAMDMDASAIVTAMLSGGVDACANLFGSRRLPSFPCTEQTLLNRILRVVARMQNAEAEPIKPLHIFLCDAGKRIGFHTPLPLSFCCLKNPSPYIRARAGKSLIEKGHTAKKHDVPF